MSVSLVLVIAMGVLYACGVFLLLERSMTRVLIGVLLVGNATNLLILIMSGNAGVAPFYGQTSGAAITDPLPQAFVLTSIVITFGLSAFLMALIYRSWRLANADIVQDDTEDVAVGRRSAASADGATVTAEDTEFGTRATAAVSTALDLAEVERLEELASIDEQRAAEELEHLASDAAGGENRTGDRQ